MCVRACYSRRYRTEWANEQRVLDDYLLKRSTADYAHGPPPLYAKKRHTTDAAVIKRQDADAAVMKRQQAGMQARRSRRRRLLEHTTPDAHLPIPRHPVVSILGDRVKDFNGPNGHYVAHYWTKERMAYLVKPLATAKNAQPTCQVQRAAFAAHRRGEAATAELAAARMQEFAAARAAEHAAQAGPTKASWLWQRAKRFTDLWGRRA